VEKLLYSLWSAPATSGDDFRQTLMREVAPGLCELTGVRGARLAVADAAVSRADGRRLESHPPVPTALLSLWVDFAGDALWEPLIDRWVARRAGYRVTEAEPLCSERTHPAAPGERVHGMCQVVWLRRPQRLDRAQWLDIWQGSHTQVAIDTQSTFGYRQNTVTQILAPGSPACDAIVEEHFPPEAMDSDHAFYASGGDDKLLQQHMTAMMESCSRFIDFAHIDVVPMSEYPIKLLAAP
jgi:hypothetical protein